MTCCKCNRTGRCRNCLCVRNGQACQNCLPQRLGNCVNTVRTQSSFTNTCDLSPPPPSPDRISDIAQPRSASPLAFVTSDPRSPTPSTPDLVPLPELPRFVPTADPVFTWGDLDSEQFIDMLNAAHAEAVHWKLNCFKVPYGDTGKSFVLEMARLFEAFATRSSLESVALKAAVLMPILLLQKPARNSKAKDHITCLKRRMVTWSKGDLSELLKEGRTIQQRIPMPPPTVSQEHLARSFANLMFQGKTNAAIRLLTQQGKGGALRLDDCVDPNNAQRTVKDILIDKHPPGQPVQPDIITKEIPQDIHPVLFESLDAIKIKSAALHTSGAAGPSGLDALSWRRLCTSFKSASMALCHSLALTAKRLCTEFIDPSITAPLTACCLIALDKNPGMRPIGIGDTARRIIAKAILIIIRQDILEAAGSLQLCVGQISGAEAAVHSVRTLFQRDETEATLLIDANNAFNSLNRQTALQNIQRLCPSLATVLINTYRAPSELYIDGKVLLSQEGTTQGDPLAMPMYAIATIPLIHDLNRKLNDINQVWYADDASATGKIEGLRKWWDHINIQGPKFGYFPNASKTWLVTKKHHLSNATSAFADTAVRVTSDGRPYLGAPLGTDEYTEAFVTSKVQHWASELDILISIARSQPHAAYAAYTHGISSKWLYLSRTIPNIGTHLQPLEVIIHSKFIPILTGKPPPNDTVRSLLALPARLGGIALSNPSQDTDIEFVSSVKITGPLSESILQQAFHYSDEITFQQLHAKSEVQKMKRDRAKQAAESLKDSLDPSLKRCVILAQEKGSSSWLTSLPIDEFGFALHKGAFRDALALRYNWPPLNAPSTCDCGVTFSIDHALSCPKGGFPSVRHNEIRDLTANLLTEVCSNVCTEPDLQPITGEALTWATSNTQDGARLDIAANGFWGGRFERTYWDVRVFNPHAPSHQQSSLSTCYRKQESLKKRAYEQRVREVEHASFTPLIFSATGGMASEATVFYKRLASRLATKWDHSYSSTLSWLRCRLSISLLRSAIQCIRGARSCIGHAVGAPPSVALVNSELNFI